ncbi:hypothetical protein ABTX77_32820 [Streptomyces sp. NPDC097704]|uniref:hypothetical protein n=1 Tax=Streptomyces sp. NPDC097704 TaxID=3157101 RepID=UPI0033259231
MVALVRRSLADRHGRVLLDEETLDRLDHDVRAPLLARGPEGSAEIVTILTAQIASLVMGSAARTPDAGGSVLARFGSVLAAVAPELDGHLQAVKADAETGRLDVVPHAPAYGTKVRWISTKLISAINEAVSGTSIRAVHVLPPTRRTTTATTTPAADPPPPLGRVLRIGSVLRPASR